MEKKTPLKQERLEHEEETARRVALDERRQSKRSANKKRKSYHIPNSDEDIGSSDGDVYKGNKNLQKRDESDSDEA
ncbi:hypothetical protein PsorP6_019272 [Peronosclerospora sorghi]|nr:hypothetical protein PsorP6_019272 [Peronosclerospora sorghi]